MSNPKLEYYAKKGLLGLDAHDLAHAGDSAGLAEMFPGAQMLAQASEAEDQGFRVPITQEPVPAPNIPRETVPEQVNRNKVALDRLDQQLKSGQYSSEEAAKIRDRLTAPE